LPGHVDKAVLIEAFASFVGACNTGTDACWYQIISNSKPLAKQDGRLPKLSELTGLGDALSDQLLMDCGLLKLTHKGVEMQSDQWETLQSYYGLGIEVTKVKCTHFLNGDTPIHLVRIGQYKASDNIQRFSAKQQATMFIKGSWSRSRMRLSSERNVLCHAIASTILSGPLLDELERTEEVEPMEEVADDDNQEQQLAEGVDAEKSPTAMEEDNVEEPSKKRPAPTEARFTFDKDDYGPKFYTARNNVKQVILRVPQTKEDADQKAFRKNMQRTQFIKLLCVSLVTGGAVAFAAGSASATVTSLSVVGARWACTRCA